MAGLTGLLNRVKKCQKIFKILNKPKVESIVYMDSNGEILWHEDVEYNPSGDSAVPLPLTLEEWEASNMSS